MSRLRVVPAIFLISLGFLITLTGISYGVLVHFAEKQGRSSQIGYGIKSENPKGYVYSVVPSKASQWSSNYEDAGIISSDLTQILDSNQNETIFYAALGKVFRLDKTGDYYEVVGLDPSTFFVRDRFFGDASHVYSSIEYQVSRADPETFEVIYYKGFPTSYARDKSRVYFTYWVSGITNELYGSDPDTFMLLAYERYEGNPQDLDIANIYWAEYAKDKNQVYIGDRPIVGADPDTFDILTTPSGKLSIFAKDSHRVYRHGISIDVNLDTFEVLDRAEATDGTIHFEGYENTVISPSTTSEKSLDRSSLLITDLNGVVSKMAFDEKRFNLIEVSKTSSKVLLCPSSYYGDTDGCRILIVDMSTNSAVELGFPDQAPEKSLLFSPDKKHILLATESRVIVIDVPTLAYRIVFTSPEGYVPGTYSCLPTFKPDVSWISDFAISIPLYDIDEAFCDKDAASQEIKNITI